MAESVEVLTMNIEVPSNGDYSKTWALTDKATGAALIDDTCLLYLDIKATQDESAAALLSLTTGIDSTVTGIVLAGDVNTSGAFQVTVRRADLEPLIDSGTKKVTLHYDFGVKFPDDFFIVYVKGKFVIDMGVTNI